MSPRRKKPAPAENHERWLISYADFITLLFAFFVVMFASSQTDKNKAQAMSDSIKSALGKDQITTAISGILGGTPGVKQQGNAQRKGPGGSTKSTVEQPEAAARIAELLPSLQMLRSQLKQEIDSGMLQVSMEARGVVVSLRQAAFFPPGQDTIDAGTYPTIQKLATVILAVPNKVRLEGHTDAVPIHNARYRSNWELSAARGVTMLELLSSRYNVPESRLSVGGYAETIAIATNDTPEGRAQNRRVDIVILNENGLKGEPTAVRSRSLSDTAPARR
jgi:Flagellar motor protein